MDANAQGPGRQKEERMCHDLLPGVVALHGGELEEHRGGEERDGGDWRKIELGLDDRELEALWGNGWIDDD
jgi:hypothetical protein